MHQDSSPVSRAKELLHPLTDHNRPIRCLLPEHEDRHPSAMLYQDGWWCHLCGVGGDELDYYCRTEGVDLREALRRLGLLNLSQKRRVRQRVTRASNGQERDLAQRLGERSTFPFEWLVAKTLAPLPGRAMRVEVLRNWDYLTERGDVSIILRFAYTIRGQAMLRHGVAESIEQPSAVGHVVRRLLEEIER